MTPDKCRLRKHVPATNTSPEIVISDVPQITSAKDALNDQTHSDAEKLTILVQSEINKSTDLVSDRNNEPGKDDGLLKVIKNQDDKYHHGELVLAYNVSHWWPCNFSIICT